MLRLVNSYLRSTRGQSRLNHLMLLSTYGEELDNLNIKELVQFFIDKNDDRLPVFGHCKQLSLLPCDINIYDHCLTIGLFKKLTKSLKNTCERINFMVKLQASTLQLY